MAASWNNVLAPYNYTCIHAYIHVSSTCNLTDKGLRLQPAYDLSKYLHGLFK